MPLCKELAKLHQVTVKQACDFLEKQGYVLADTQGTKAMLMHTLLLTHCAPPSIIARGVHAVATLLECEVANHTTEGASEGIVKRVKPILGSAKQAVEQAQAAVTDTRKAANMFFSMCEEARDKIHRATEIMKEEVQKAVKGARDELYKVTEELDAATSGTAATEGMPMRSQAGQGGRVTYAEALGIRLSLAHPNTLARTKVRE